MQLKSKHMWPATEEFLRPGHVYVDEHSEICTARSTPDWVVAAMLEDLKAMEAECERLRERVGSLHVVAGKIAESGGDSLTQMARDWQAENARLHALLDEQWTPLESEPGAWANGYEHKMCRRRAE